MAVDESFNFGPVPASPQVNVTATYAELKTHPELYFKESSCLKSTVWHVPSNCYAGRRCWLHDAGSGACLFHDSWSLPTLFRRFTATVDTHSRASSSDHHGCSWIGGKFCSRSPGFKHPSLTSRQWYMWGYSLAFSPGTFGPSAFRGVSWYGGDSKATGFIDVVARPVGIQGPDPNVMTGPKIPEMLYVFYQGMFACFT